MTNSTNRQAHGRAVRNVNPFSTRGTLEEVRLTHTRNQQNRVRGGVVTPPHPNDPIVPRVDTSGLAAQEDMRLMDSVRRSVRQLEDESFFQSIMSTSINNGRQTGRSSLFDYPSTRFFGDPRDTIRETSNAIRDRVEAASPTRRTVVLPRPENNFTWNGELPNTGIVVDQVRGETHRGAEIRTTPAGMGFTGPLGFNLVGDIIREDRTVATPREARVGGLGHQPTMNWGDVRATPPVTDFDGDTVGAGITGGSDSMPPFSFFEQPLTKKTLVDILRNEFELKIDARKYGDRLEFKISLFNTTTKEEVLSAEDYVEMDN
jgi:hypothetical protein